MNKLELQKMANEVEKELSQAFMQQKLDIQAVLYPQQIFLHIYILRK